MIREKSWWIMLGTMFFTTCYIYNSMRVEDEVINIYISEEIIYSEIYQPPEEVTLPVIDVKYDEVHFYVEESVKVSEIIKVEPDEITEKFEIVETTTIPIVTQVTVDNIYTDDWDVRYKLPKYITNNLIILGFIIKF